MYPWYMTEKEKIEKDEEKLRRLTKEMNEAIKRGAEIQAARAAKAEQRRAARQKASEAKRVEDSKTNKRIDGDLDESYAPSLKVRKTEGIIFAPEKPAKPSKSVWNSDIDVSSKSFSNWRETSLLSAMESSRNEKDGKIKKAASKKVFKSGILAVTPNSETDGWKNLSTWKVKPYSFDNSANLQKTSTSLTNSEKAEKVGFGFAKFTEQRATASSNVLDVSSGFTDFMPKSQRHVEMTPQSGQFQIPKIVGETVQKWEKRGEETIMQKNFLAQSELLQNQNERNPILFKQETQTRPNPTNAFSGFAGKSIKKEVECVEEFEYGGNQNGFANSPRSYDIKPQIAKLAYPKNFAKVYGKSTDEADRLMKPKATNSFSGFGGKSIKMEVACVDEFEYGGNQNGFANSSRSYDIKPQIAKFALPKNVAEVRGKSTDLAETAKHSEQPHQKKNMQTNLVASSELLQNQNERKPVLFNYQIQTQPEATNSLSGFAGKSIKKEVVCADEFEYGGNQNGFANSSRNHDIKPQIAKFAYPKHVAKIGGNSTDVAETSKQSEVLHQEKNMQKNLVASSEHLNIQNESQPVSFNHQTQTRPEATNSFSGFAGKSIKKEVETADEFEYGGNQKGLANSPRSYDIKPQIAKLAYPKNFAKVYGKSTDETDRLIKSKATNSFSGFAGKSIKKEVACVDEFEYGGNQKSSANSSSNYDMKPQIAKFAYPKHVARIGGKSTDVIETLKQSVQLHKEKNMQKNSLASSEHLNIQNESQPVSFNHATQSVQNPTNSFSGFAGKSIKKEVACVDEFEYGGNQKSSANSSSNYDMKPQIAKFAYPKHVARIGGKSTDVIETLKQSVQLHKEKNMQKNSLASSEHLNIQNESQPVSFNHATQSVQNPTNSFSGFAGKSIKKEVACDKFEYGGIGKRLANSPSNYDMKPQIAKIALPKNVAKIGGKSTDVIEPAKQSEVLHQESDMQKSFPASSQHLNIQNERKRVSFKLETQTRLKSTKVFSGIGRKSIKKEVKSADKFEYGGNRKGFANFPRNADTKIAKFVLPKNVAKD
ncbi:unnamed protein product [Caenorhabditis angaria]|uniref:Uncharacterized protein n=1 Tax=Caenorhabditis angaria TaxID=860376 RepID=A0A9P1J4M4_9PELO|nr:unnamed protein product [Caenorhabditis angaria]